METSEDFFDMRNVVLRSRGNSEVISGQHVLSKATLMTNILTFKNLGYLDFGQNTVFEDPY